MADDKLIPDAAVQAIKDSVETKTIEVGGGVPFVTRPVYEPPCDPVVAPLTIHTLTGLVGREGPGSREESPGQGEDMKVKTITLDPKTWDRGNAYEEVYMLGPNGRCCLGFLAQQERIPDSELRLVTYPAEVKNATPTKLWGTLLDPTRAIGDSQLCIDLMRMNDEPNITDEARLEGLNGICEAANAPFRFELST